MHCFESGFFVREKAWHGLGQLVQEAPTSADALSLAGLNWTVSSEPLYTKSGVEIPNYKANTRSSDNSILGVVTDKYKIVQNAEAFDFTDMLINEEVKYESAGSLKNGKTIWLLAKMPETKILDDSVEPYICFTNSHDGLGAIKVCMTPVRVVCQNTLNMALNTAQRKWSTRHIGNMSEKLEEAKNTLQLANDYMTQLNSTAEELVEKKVTEDDLNKILATVFPVDENDSNRKKANVEQIKDNFYMCYLSPDILKFKNTAWGVINAAADFADHIAPSRASQNYKENNWARIMDGHYILDAVTSLVTAK